MKNFSEATAIRHSLTIDAALTITPIGSLPCVVKINQTTVFDGVVSAKTLITHQLPLTSPINFSIQVYRNHPDAIQLALTIDEEEILPKYQYLANPPTDYIDFNQIWTLDIPNFYTWLHQESGQGWIV